MKKINLLIAGLLSLSLNTQAAPGGGSADTGGGNAVGNQLLDLFENEGTTTINVTQLKAYQQVVAPLLSKIDKKIPGFASYLSQTALEKVWLMDTKALSNACINSSIVKAAKTVVACQNSLEVRIFKTWYNNVDLKNQAALVVHELFRDVALRTNELSDEEVNFLTRTFVSEANYTDLQLGEILEKAGLGQFILQTDYEKVHAIHLQLYKKYCTGSQRPSGYKAMGDLLQISGDQSEVRVRRLLRETSQDLYDIWINTNDLQKSDSQTCSYFNKQLSK